jgi:CDP-diacylglycerol pyrophosphatase
MARDPLKIICDIIKSEMALSDGQIWVYNNKRNIPDDDGLYIVVSAGAVQTIGTKRAYQSDPDALKEITAAHCMASVSIDILSRSSDARTRKEEIILALNSTYSQQQQEKHSVSIGCIPTGFTDVSFVEETAQMNRFNLSFNITYKTEKIKTVEYYNTFNKQVITDR